MEVGKRKTKIEINIPLTQEAINKLKMLIEEFAEEFKVDNVKIKDNKYLKKQKHIKKVKVEEEKKERELSDEEKQEILDKVDNSFAELEELVKRRKNGNKTD